MAMVGRPDSTERTTCSCPLRKASYPKCCCSACERSRSIPSSFPPRLSANGVNRRPPPFERAVEAGLGDDQVIDDANAERMARLVEKKLQALVLAARRRIARRMVVQERHRGCLVQQDRQEGFLGGYRARGDAAGSDAHAADLLEPGAQQDGPELLAPERREPSPKKGGDVLGMQQPRPPRRGGKRDPAAKLDRG